MLCQEGKRGNTGLLRFERLTALFALLTQQKGLTPSLRLSWVVWGGTIFLGALALD